MIIVTGGAGFIGSAIIAGLNGRGLDNILVVDELGTDAKWMNLRTLAYADYVEKGDFLEMVVNGQIAGPVEAIIHMGACSSTTETNASYLAKNNYEYTKFLAQWATSDNIRFIYASSAATYGDGELGFADDHGLVRSLQPLNMYGYSKQMFDLWALRAGLLDKIVGLKFFNVFGPNEYHKGPMQSFVLKAFEQIRDSGKVRLFKSHREGFDHGCQLRDFIYIKDAVAMTLYFLDNAGLGGLYNIGTGKARSWNDLVKAVYAAMGLGPDIEYVDMPESIANQYQYFTQADMAKLADAGYGKGAAELEDAVADYVKNYLQTGAFLSADDIAGF